jgi:hypothetical protein
MEQLQIFIHIGIQFMKAFHSLRILQQDMCKRFPLFLHQDRRRHYAAGLKNRHERSGLKNPIRCH